MAYVPVMNKLKEMGGKPTLRMAGAKKVRDHAMPYDAMAASQWARQEEDDEEVTTVGRAACDALRVCTIAVC